jgi:Fe-S cluster assembly scaffold protein SufB
MCIAKSQVEIIVIKDLAALQNLEIKQGQNLQIQFVSTQNILQPISLRITQLADSSLRLVFLVTNSIELDLDFVILGDHTKTSIYNLVDLNENSKVVLNQKIITSFDNNKVQHKTKCLLEQNSQANVDHAIKAHHSSSNLKLEQKIQTLILSPTAKVVMQPILQIESQDVQCRHGATQGLLDQTTLFYLQSRGLNLKVSKQLLTDVFKSEILDLMILNKL